VKITNVHIDGFGAWDQLDLNDLSDRITVFYGPNEAGKTTLLEFVRSVLYGMTPARRARYLPPRHGGRAGGSLRVTFQDGQYDVRRRTDAGDPADGLLVVTTPDGSTCDHKPITRALQGIDEPTYRNLFAVGLQELQQLGTLSDGDAARWLYELTTGLDRVSLSAVMRELAESRERLLGAGGRSTVLGKLAARYQQLSGELEQLPTIAGVWSELASQRTVLERQIERLEADCRACHETIVSIDRAVAVDAPWQRRIAIDEELARAGALPRLPAGAIEQLNALLRRRKRCRGEAKKFTELIAEGKAKLRRMGRQQALWHHAPRIEALREQLEWIVSMEAEIREHDERVSALKSEWDSHRRQLGGENEHEATDVAVAAAKVLPQLRVLAREVRTARHQVTAAKAKLTTCQRGLASHDAANHGDADADLPAAVQRAGEHVAQLRRRLAIDERLDEMHIHARDLDEKSSMLLDRQLMPLGVLVGLGAVFVLGVVLILIGLFFPRSIVGMFGRTLGLLGVFGTGTAAAVKFLTERSQAKQLEGCQRQAEVLGQQIGEAQQERDALDEQLPRGGGPLAQRLQTAERSLATLEAQLPRHAQWQQASRDTELAQRELDTAQQQLGAVRQRWKQALVQAGLPPDLTPRRLRDLAGHRQRLDALERRWERGRDELAQRRRQYDAVARRIDQLATDVGLASDGLLAGDLVRQLQRMWDCEKPQLVRRRKLRRRLQRWRHQRSRTRRTLRALTRQRDALLSQAGVDRIDAYRQMALETARVERLRRERETVSREIAATLDASGQATEIEAMLVAHQTDSLSVRRQQATDALARYQQQLKDRAAELGGIVHQLDQLADDRRREEKTLLRSQIEVELREAAARWQTHAVTWLLLDSVRDEYQRTRQPETLVEASGYLRRLTGGRYLRVWTPLDEAVLYVDDTDGQSLSVEVLSRGTREQLFLSLRLALIACYARRHVQLPVVLDDVLVNFDVGRVKAAAHLLRDFAHDGHQLLVFTCHRHVWRMFRSMRVDTRRLPHRTDRQPVGAVAVPAGDALWFDRHENDPQLVVEEPDAAVEAEPLEVWTAVEAEPSASETAPVGAGYEVEVDVEGAHDGEIDVPATPPTQAGAAIDVNAVLAAESAVDPVTVEAFEVFPPAVGSVEPHDPPRDPPGRPRTDDAVIISEDWVRVGAYVRRRERLPGARSRDRERRSVRNDGDDLGASAA